MKEKRTVTVQKKRVLAIFLNLQKQSRNVISEAGTTINSLQHSSQKYYSRPHLDTLMLI